MLLCMMLTMAMAITAVGCGSKTENTTDTQKNTEISIVNTESTVETEAVAETESVDAAVAQEIILGEGSVKFTFIVVDADGNETNFVVSTDKETVGDALLELNLIEGEEGDYGLYVKTVNGITADYDTDHTYWAFYVNGEYSNTGVDSTPVNEGDTYEFKVENNEAENKGSGNIRYAGCFDVCIKSIYGITAECTFTWSFYHFFYTCLSEKSTVPDLHVCIIEWVVCGICDMVDTVSVSLDDSLGRDHAAPTKFRRRYSQLCI